MADGHFMDIEERVDINAKLIKIVQEYPHLYNHENISTEIKQFYWSKVTVQLKGEGNPSKDEVAQVRQRWKNLRDSYVKDFKLTTLQKQHNLARRKGWRYASQMTFLNPYISTRGPLKSLIDIERKSVLDEFDSETSQSGSEQTDIFQRDCIIKWIGPYPELILKKGAVFCTFCLKNINADTKYKLVNHVRTAQHLARTLLGQGQQEGSGSNSSRADPNQDFDEYTSISYSPSSTSDAQPTVIEHDVTVIKEEYDDTFEETVEEVSPITKEELMDILNQSELNANTETGVVSPKQHSFSNVVDLPSINKPPSKKSRLDIVTVNGDESDSNHQLLEEPTQEINVKKKIEDDRDLVGKIDSSGNIDLFFQSMSALAKTLSPLDQVLLQKNVADVVFEMKIAQLTKKNMSADLTKSS